jgi:hypothetical protein
MGHLTPVSTGENQNMNGCIAKSHCFFVTLFALTAFAQTQEVVPAFDTPSPFERIQGRWCGAQGQWISKVIPDEWPSVCNAYTRNARFYQACKQHDACYSTLGVQRSECDRNFLEDLVHECEDAFFTWVCQPSLLECQGVSRLYYEGVVAFGVEPFRNSQERARQPVSYASERP